MVVEGRKKRKTNNCKKQYKNFKPPKLFNTIIYRDTCTHSPTDLMLTPDSTSVCTFTPLCNIYTHNTVSAREALWATG